MSARGVDPLGGNWSRHSRDWWQGRAEDERLDMWLRVTAFAYAKHANNGHATFDREELAGLLAGSGAPPIRQRLGEYIGQAIKLGFLAEGSTSMCLVVPAYAIDKGRLGEPKPVCRVHARRARKKKARVKVSEIHAQAADALLKVSRSDPDALEQVSGDHAGIPDASRSGPISYYPSPHATVSRRATPTADREASA